MKTHDLKTWPDVFQAIVQGVKTHEFRRNDRDFRAGDTLCLREWKPTLDDDGAGAYTGRMLRVIITHINYGPSWGIPDGYAAMSIFANAVTRALVDQKW